MNAADILIFVCTLISTLYGIYFLIICLIGVPRPRKSLPGNRPVKRLAVIIAARNEECVIPRIMKSLREQKYPARLYDVYVFPNNCTDKTAEAALREGAIVIPPDVPVHSKGDVLKFAFEKLQGAEARYDAYIIFDADNYVDANFLRVANDALISGMEAAQGYRDAINPHENWIAGGTALFFWGMDGFFHRARSAAKMSATLNGTGIMMSAGTVAKIGGTTYSLTEDLELSALCAFKGIKIGWMEDAITYDEQPPHMIDSFNQRRRWFAGSFQCFFRYAPKLLAHALGSRSLQAFDMMMLFTGPLIQFLGMIPPIIIVARGIIALATGATPLLTLAIELMGAIIVMYLGLVLFATAICACEKKLKPRAWRNIAMFPVFMFTWLPANLSLYVMGVPKWRRIRRSKFKFKMEDDKNVVSG